MELLEKIEILQQAQSVILQQVANGVAVIESKGHEHGTMLLQLVAGVKTIEEQGLRHLRDIATAANKLADSDEIKVKIIAGQSWHVLALVVALLAFCTVIFLALQSYDMRAKSQHIELEVKR